MLKYQKKLVDNSIELMKNAHNELYALITMKQTNEALDLLQLCQELMIQIGESIEKSEGDSYTGIHDMEMYCEYVYLISQHVDQPDKYKDYLIDLSSIFSKITAQMQSIRIKKEVVFFPYNAAMWDSLESIWIAAEKDPDVEAYVIPIPYYENRDEEYVERYDLDKFPSYVPVIDYRKYNLKERQPDIAYIHNPYDRFNRVTSVHPDYYSDELKKNVSKVVYVPYFIAYEEVSNSHRDLPVYYHVDYIVVPCEKMIGSFAPTVKREKFIPFGNPIADRIIYLDKNRPQIPESWKSMLANGKDFGGKKVVMYNTSLSMVMTERENFIDKIEYVLHTFREIDDVIMVWRPHPLIHATLQTIGGGLYQRFLKIEDMFLQEHIGVLDKTADVGIAVSLCDAYIGENASSIIHMFGIAGKPRFYNNLQNYIKYSVVDECKITTFGIYSEEETEYFVAEEYRCICKRNKIDGKIVVLAQIPGTKWYPYGAYKDIYKRGDNIYLQPYSGQGLVIYNLRKASFRKIYVRDSSEYGFMRMYVKNTSLFLIPKTYPCIVKFDLETEDLQYYSSTDEEVQGIMASMQFHGDTSDCVVYQLPHQFVRRFKAEELKQRTGGSIVCENKENRLQDFLYYITEDGLHNNEQAKLNYVNKIETLDGTCGEKIHVFVKNSLG